MMPDVDERKRYTLSVARARNAQSQYWCWTACLELGCPVEKLERASVKDYQRAVLTCACNSQGAIERGG